MGKKFTKAPTTPYKKPLKNSPDKARVQKFIKMRPLLTFQAVPFPQKRQELARIEYKQLLGRMVGSVDLNADAKNRFVLKITVSVLRRGCYAVQSVTVMTAKTLKTTLLLQFPSEKVGQVSKVVYVHGQIVKKTIVFATLMERSANYNARGLTVSTNIQLPNSQKNKVYFRIWKKTFP